MIKNLKFIIAACVIVCFSVLGYQLVQKTKQVNKTLGEINRYTTAPTNTAVACESTSTLAIATSSGRTYVAIVNDSASTIYLGLGVPAVGSNGIRLNGGGGSYEIDLNNLFTGAINCIASSTSVITVINQPQ